MTSFEREKEREEKNDINKSNDNITYFGLQIKKKGYLPSVFLIVSSMQ